VCSVPIVSTREVALARKEYIMTHKEEENTRIVYAIEHDPLTELREACEYDPQGDSSVDSLIDYKNALEDEVYRLLTEKDES
jgi:hypothetical protein